MAIFFPRILLSLSLLAALALLNEASMQCYYCQSSKSLEDCERKQTLQRNCMANITTSCYIFQSVGADGTRSYGKSCIKSSMCNKATGCHLNSTECHVYCCQESLCNQKSSSVLVKPIGLLIVAMASAVTSWW